MLRAGESTKLRGEAVALLAARGVADDAALFVLGLSPEGSTTVSDAGHVARTAYELDLPCPLERSNSGSRPEETRRGSSC